MKWKGRMKYCNSTHTTEEFSNEQGLVLLDDEIESFLSKSAPNVSRLQYSSIKIEMKPRG